MASENKKRIASTGPWWLLGVMTLMFFCQMLYTPLTGDDLAYANTFAGAEPYRESFAEYPRWCAFHWLHVNGRLANLLMPALAIGPHWLLCALCAAAFFALYWTAAKASGSRGLWTFVLFALISWCLPWWDYMTIFDCQLNYIWASALSLGAYLLVSRDLNNNWQLIPAILICFMGGMFHEGASVALCAGFILYAIVSGWRPSPRQWPLLAAFALGTAIVTFSPGIILRATGAKAPDDSPLWIFLKSDPIAGLLWLVVIAGYILPRFRPGVVEFFKSKISILAIAAFVSMIISLASGIVGRSGWFAELFSIIVIIERLSKWKTPKVAILQSLIVALLFYQSADLMLWQARIHRDYEKFETEYKKSPDGVVNLPALRDTDMPWWTLGRLRAIPDADDMYLLDKFARFHRADHPWPIVVAPTDSIAAEKPAGMRRIDYPDSEVYVTTVGGHEYVVDSVRGQWRLTPRVDDPGDRWTLKP